MDCLSLFPTLINLDRNSFTMNIHSSNQGPYVHLNDNFEEIINTYIVVLNNKTLNDAKDMDLKINDIIGAYHQEDNELLVCIFNNLKKSRTIKPLIRYLVESSKFSDIEKFDVFYSLLSAGASVEEKWMIDGFKILSKSSDKTVSLYCNNLLQRYKL